MKYTIVILFLFISLSTKAQYPLFTVDEISEAIEGSRVIRMSSYMHKDGGVSVQLKGIAIDSLAQAITEIKSPRLLIEEHTATTNQLEFLLSENPNGNSIGLGMVACYRNGLLLSINCFSRVGATLTYIPVNNGNQQLANGDRINFIYTTIE